MANDKLKGTFTALITPLNDNGVDYDTLNTIIEYQIKEGINGLVSVGTTGESPTLSYSEHLEVIKFTVEISKGRVPVYAGTGSNSTGEAIDLTKKACKAGADGFLQVAPYYNKPSQEGIFSHFSSIAEITDKPIILYSIPSRCGIEISADTTERLFSKYPNICSFKAAEGSCDKVSQLVNRLGNDFSVLSGDDGLTLPFMSCGASGVISVASNLIANPIVKMVNFANSNDYENARKIFLNYYKFFNAIFIEPNPVPIKYCLKRAGIIKNDLIRLPLSPLNKSSKALLDDLLKNLNLIS